LETKIFFDIMATSHMKGGVGHSCEMSIIIAVLFLQGVAEKPNGF
jgi:hypothetical protein